MAFYQTANIQPLNPGNPVLLLNQKIDYLNSGFQQPSSVPSLTNITGGAHTYTASEMLNRYTIRSALTSNPVTDAMPTASQIVAALNNYQTNNQHSYLTRGTPINTGFYFDWTLVNNDSAKTLVVSGNTGVTFSPSSTLNVLPSSYVVMRVTVTNITAPAVSVSTLSNVSSGGGSVPSGTFWGDYLYWNPTLGGGQWVVGSPNVTLGRNAGQTSQGASAVAVGSNAGNYNQGTQAVAIGVNAGRNAQGSNAVAIGCSAGSTNQHQNSIILNATGSVLNSDSSNAIYIDPVRNSTGSTSQFNSLYYNSTNKEMSYLPNEYVNVKTYGAYGDGTTDDTTAIQNCINSNPGKVIFFPQGTYAISATLDLAGVSNTNNTQFLGVGTGIIGSAGSTILQTTNNINILNVVPTNISTVRLDGIVIKNLNFSYKNPGSITGGTALYFRRTWYTNIENVTVNNAWQAFSFNGFHHTFLTNVMYSSASNMPVSTGGALVEFSSDYYLSGGTPTHSYGYLAFLNNCVFDSNWNLSLGKVFTKTYGIRVNAGDGIVFNNVYLAGYLDSNIYIKPGLGSTPYGTTTYDYVTATRISNCYLDCFQQGTPCGIKIERNPLGIDPGSLVTQVFMSDTFINFTQNAIYVDYPDRGAREPSLFITNSSLNYYYVAGVTPVLPNSSAIRAFGGGGTTFEISNSLVRSGNSQPCLDVADIFHLQASNNNFLPSGTSVIYCHGTITVVNLTGNVNQGTSTIPDISYDVGAVITSLTTCGNLSNYDGNGSWAQIKTTRSNLAIGNSAGSNLQGSNAVAIGNSAGFTSQSSGAIAIGFSSGSNSQATNAIAIGQSSGKTNQGQNSIAIGYFSASTNQDSNAVAIGREAGSSNQASIAIAMGLQAGCNAQGIQSIAIGFSSGLNTQGAVSIAIGTQAGQENQAPYCIAIGSNAGRTNQSSNCIAIGCNSASCNQQSGAIAIGISAGANTQGTNSVAIGGFAGQSNQQSGAVAIGVFAGTVGQSANTVAVGNQAGNNSQSSGSVAIGVLAASTGQNLNAVAIGANAGCNSQGSTSVAIGFNAGNASQGTGSIAMGCNAGFNSQGVNAIALGSSAGRTNQGSASIAIGYTAGQFTQSIAAIAIGSASGNNSQGSNAIAIGNQAGRTNQGINAISIGCNAGQNTQGDNCIAIGTGSALFNQNLNAIAIGCNAGSTGQGSNAIAIGNQAGRTNQAASSIVICASGTAVNGTTASSTYIAPIRNVTFTNTLGYDPVNFEVVYSSKTFVIDHPKDDKKYLVHACLEGPEAGVYYRGKGEITNGDHVDIELPEYTKSFTDFTVHVTPISHVFYSASDVENGKFIVRGQNGSFSWLVFARRLSIEVEPSKDLYQLKGDGPYTYLQKK